MIAYLSRPGTFALGPFLLAHLIFVTVLVAHRAQLSLLGHFLDDDDDDGEQW